MKAALDDGGPDLLPASALYALAAFQGGHTYINFTPSLGASVPALLELARSTGSLYAGKDGKTGETLMKTVLAPDVRAPQSEGDELGRPQHLRKPRRPGPRRSRQQVIQGGNQGPRRHPDPGLQPASVVTIEYLADMGDWKTAWDHIHFQGFLGAKMALQFTWQGCDSLLAAPLAIDLARLADLEKRRGGRGLMRHLACFFKSPEGVEENDFFKQFNLLAAHVTGPAEGLRWNSERSPRT